MANHRVCAIVILRCLILCILLHFSVRHSAAAKPSNVSDHQALIAFKKGVTLDPFRVLSSWNDSTHFCDWRGVLCSSRHQRVTILSLSSQQLSGSISPFLGNLTFLKRINLRNNSFHGEIPKELGRLFRLEAIGLTSNLLDGEIPVNLTYCSHLMILDLVDNNLVGGIPLEIGDLSKLVGLGLAVNNLTGSIPQSISNLSSLIELSLSENNLGGDIPIELGELRQLKMFQISSNKFLTGSIPIKLFNISSLESLMVAENQLVGEIPSYIGLTLPNLRLFQIGSNRFTGSLPHSISNATKLEHFTSSKNHFRGSIPGNLGNLKNLIWLNLGNNQLGTGKGDDLNFINSLVNCSNLEVLALDRNNISGVLPNSIANLSSTLQYLIMGSNRISGSIPAEILNLRSLILIGMEENLITGTIPDSIGSLPNLQVLSLFGSKFSGKIPSSLGNLTLLSELDLSNNAIQGTIPSSLGNCHQLAFLSLSGNNLSGTIPKQVIDLPSLSRWLGLSQNSLVGSIPSEVGNLRNLRQMDVSNNKLSGEIPTSLGSCVSLDLLYLGGNSFEGHIPSSLSALRGIEDLDLSRNNFSGRIPDFLLTLPFLQNLNLSFNNLEGEVPKEGIFRNASAVAILGNTKLCGGITDLHLKSCPSIGLKKPRLHLRPKVIIIIVCLGFFAISISFFLIFLWRKKTRKDVSVESPSDRKLLKVSYPELLKATEGFSSANLIGIGSYGAVYKGILGVEESVVAVKVLDLQQRGASRSFVAECEALRNIRHRNLVKVITSCSSVDFRGNEFKALVFEFMPNGSLDNWLNSKAAEQNQRQILNFKQRVSIAVDVAHALDYLHNHAQPPVIHCDLKPSNILLDDEMDAHVGDFGLARLLYDKSSQSQTQTSSSRVKGTVGYVAPEYGMASEISTHGDVYSYGILLLEMFTGRRPTDEIFKDGRSLHNFANTAIPDKVLEVIDPALLEELFYNQDKEEFNQYLKSDIEKHLISIIKLGVSCSDELPTSRLDMKDVAAEIQTLHHQTLLH